MAPVMFELGARPHPPRELYRAYLEQSDIFVGVYWEEYGWVAPGEDVSGLEDEWVLAPDIPKLVYLKRSEHRQERLEALLARIREDGDASYAMFSNAEELADLVIADLASVLAERFDAAVLRRAPIDVPEPSPSATTAGALVAVPSPLTPLLGRDAELAAVVRMLTVDGSRLVTLTGPGGIGKSRLAIAAAREVEASFPDGVVFVDLAPVLDPALVTAAVARALGVVDDGSGSIGEDLGPALADRRMLLLLDNVEQVVDAAPELAGLIRASAVSVLATSRILLRVGGEHSLALGPLDPAAATDLLVDRARAVKPDFELTDQNSADITAICTALDNAPLALELAAARLRVLTPAALVDRLGHALSLLTTGDRDLPERQRTLRATIEWSAQLLHQEERELLLRLGVFRAGFGLDAAEWMAEDVDSVDDVDGVDVVDALAALVDGSLVREQDRGDRAWFTMLATLREYGREQLGRRGDLGEMEERHAQFYAALADASGRSTGTGQVGQMARLADERDELRAAVDHFFATRQYAALTQLTWSLYWFWWVSGQLGEVRRWMSRLLTGGIDLDERSRIIALFWVNSIRFGETSDDGVVAALAECVAYFRVQGDRFGEGLSSVTLAIAQMSEAPPDLHAVERTLTQSLELIDEIGDPFARTMVRIMLARAAMGRGRMADAFELLDRSLEIARGVEDRLGEGIALNHLGWARLLVDDPDGARGWFTEQLRISAAFGHEEGLAFGLEGMSAVAAVAGDLYRAGMLFGATEAVRLRKGLTTGGTFSVHGRIIERVLADGGTATYEAARRAGRGADLDDMVELALAGVAPADDAGHPHEPAGRL
jgi:predicted ATPase